MSKRKTTEEFIAEAKLVHGDKYDYSATIYINGDTPVNIVCRTHGEFFQHPASHTKGYGCSACSGKLKHNKETFSLAAGLVHNNEYNYSKVEYINNSTKVNIICKIHGEFQQTPHAHLSGKRCPDCYGTVNYTNKEFITKAINLHGNKYKYDKVNYVNNSTKVVVSCPIHGNWNCIPVEHLRGCGCPHCSENGFNPSKPAYLYYLKITTDTNQILYKIGITNRTVEARFNLTDLAKIEIVKQKLYENGQDALDWETKLKRQFKEYQYKGPDILSSGNTELFTEDIIAMWHNAQVNE